MQEKKRKVILGSRETLLRGSENSIERATRDGIELEKGAVITNEYLERHKNDFENALGAVMKTSRNRIKARNVIR